ncbi:hypothetical protein DPEC_G00125930 [Dallia pectoralis]|uniref:Uncharacterized protein n=1 Tax=Dallia pectoralis TaxID=75939 RepID=A0ACC2GRB5_DALPE|nr:hypothetical protein DPEC_G00125930 [Dallia pectoralis]
MKREMSDSEEMDLSSLEIVEVKVEALKSVLGQRVKELKADFAFRWRLAIGRSLLPPLPASQRPKPD